MSLLEMVGTILTELEKVQEKLDRLLAWATPYIVARLGEEPKKEPTVIKHSPGFEDYKPTVVEKVIIKGGKTIPATTLNNFALPKTGKHQWYSFANREDKVRKCDNQGCNMFLMWNKDKKTYEHWKYDVNTGKGGYVQDKCDYYSPEGT